MSKKDKKKKKINAEGSIAPAAVAAVAPAPDEAVEEVRTENIENTENTEAETEEQGKDGKKKRKHKKKFNFKEYFANNLLFVVFVVSLVLDSLVLRAFTVKFGDGGTVLTVLKAIFKPMLADIAAVIVIGVFGFLIKKQKNRFKFLMVWTVILSILAAGNSVYYTNYKSFLSFSLLSTASQLGGVMDAVTENILEAKDFIMLFPIITVTAAYIFLTKKKGKEYTRIKQPKTSRAAYASTSLVIALGSGLLFSTMLTGTDCSRLIKQWNRESVMSSFGMYVYQISDVVSTLNAKVNMIFGYEENKQHFDEFFDSESSDDSESTVVDETSEEEENEFTGIFEGKNVLVIHAESIQDFTLYTSFNGEELTPNLNKLRSEGLYFSNFYAQESVGTSSDSEFTFSSSLLPASSGTVAINYWDRNYTTTQKKFKEKGYYVFSMHGNNGSYWNRLNLHASLGYDRLYNYTTDFDIDETIGLGLSDKSFFSQAVPKIKDIKEEYGSFYGTLIMLTNHTPFTDIERVSDYEVNFKYKQYNEETGMYEEVTRDFLEGTKLGSYFKSVHYADEAIGQLMTDLDEEGLLDNTVVIIYGDHDAKIKEEEYEYYYNYNPFTDETLTSSDEGYTPIDEFYYNLNRKVPLIIWSKDGGYEPQEITKVMGMYDVQPTLGNMFGFENKYALGHDIFSFDEDEENIVIFPNGNFVTDSVYYDSQKDVYFDLADYQNPAKLVSCNQTYKDDPIPLYTDERDGLYKATESDFSEEKTELKKNNGVVDEQYITDRAEYAAERIDISNAIIYYDMIEKSESGFSENVDTNSISSETSPFKPREEIDRKRAYAA